MFVQTRNQVYLYDCDGILLNQYSSVTPSGIYKTGCSFVRRILNNETKPITNIKPVLNTLIVYFEDSTIDVIYTLELLKKQQARLGSKKIGFNLP